MTVRLSHRQKPDTQNYIFQALGRSFSLTGIATSLRVGFRMSIPDKIPYIYTGYAATVSKLPPVWGTLSPYTVAQTTALSAQILPITVPGGGSPYITVAWHSSSVPSTQPTWVTLTSGQAPTIAFTGDANQVDSADVSSMVISAVANGQTRLSNGASITVTAAPSGSLTITYSQSSGQIAEGDALPLYISGGALYWQSSWATKDGTLIEWGTGDHGHHVDNSVREYDPSTKVQTRVEPYHVWSQVIGSDQWYGVDYGYESQHDNLLYYYIPRIDSLVIPTRGQYVRGSSGRPASQSWPLATRTEVNYTQNIAYGAGTSVHDGQPLGWKGAEVTSTNTASLFRPYGSYMNSGPDYINVFQGQFNAHQAWSAQFDCGVKIGGAPAGGSGSAATPGFFVVAPSYNFGGGSYPQPYVVFRTATDIPTNVSGANPATHVGRDGCCFVGPYVYWVGGGEPTQSQTRAYFWRTDIRPHLLSDSAPLSIERLPDAPFVVESGLLRHDPYSNVLLLVAENGIAMFDLRSSTWSVITPSEYDTFFAANYLSYSGPYRPAGCVGDFIDTRNSQQLRKFYWRAGNNYSTPYAGGVWGTNETRNLHRFHSLKVIRPADPIYYVTTNSEHPENTSSDWTNILEGQKHMGLMVSGSGSNRKMYVISGDFSGYPNSLGTTGYKNEGSFAQDARQDVWRADISDSAIASNIRFKLVSNGYAWYPWLGSTGYNTGAAKGPRAPDAMGSCTDKRGQVWVGPMQFPGYWDSYPEWAGQKLLYAPMFKWNQPGTNNTAVTGGGVNGVALGNAWTIPNQDRLYNSMNQGTFGVDYDISSSGASDSHGWGRTNARGSVYDFATDKIYTISLGINKGTSGKDFTIALYGFSCVPDGGGVHRWTKTTVTKAVKDFGGPPDNQYTGAVTLGDPITGSINMAPELIDRRLYFVLAYDYYPTGDLANTPLRRGQHARAVLLSIDIDNPTGTNGLEWIPFPASQNWWCRMFDGPYQYESGQIGLPNNSAPCSTPAQQRGLTAIGTKLVLGPDCWTQIGVDPMLQVYDTIKKTWTSFAPPTSHDYPNTLDALVGVPEIGEAWLAGHQAIGDSDDAKPFVIANNLHYPPANASRRIVRFDIGASHKTTFAGTESAISENGFWTNGLANGLQWNNVTTSGGYAYGATTVGGYNDCIAIHNYAYANNQYVQATVYKDQTYTAPASHEVELLLRFSISANDARGYEILWGFTGELNIVRWNGPYGSYQGLLGPTGPNIGAAVTGDVLRAEIIGSTITVYKNGTQVASVPDTTFTSGKPGIGFWPTGTSTPSKYCWSDFLAGDL